MIVQSLKGTSGEAFKGVYVLLKPLVSQAVGEMYVCEREGLILPPAHCLAIPRLTQCSLIRWCVGSPVIGRAVERAREPRWGLSCHPELDSEPVASKTLLNGLEREEVPVGFFFYTP